MSYLVTNLVAGMRLPKTKPAPSPTNSASVVPFTRRRRATAKAVLFRLADRTDDAGENAWPSVPTLAAECEVSRRTVDACLDDLVAIGLISEQFPPRHQRPRIWRLNLERIQELSESQSTCDSGNRPGSQKLSLLGRSFRAQGRRNEHQGRKYSATERPLNAIGTPGEPGTPPFQMARAENPRQKRNAKFTRRRT